MNEIQNACTNLGEALAQVLAAVLAKSENGGSQNAGLGADLAGARPLLNPPEQYDLGPVLDVEPGQRLYVYMAGARGLAVISRAHGCTITAALGLATSPYVVKCGTTSIPLEGRLRQIGRDRYGSAVETAHGFVSEPGFERWIAHAIAPSREPHDPAVTLLPRAIAVDLPDGLTRRGFDGALHRMLSARALSRLPTSVIPKRYVAYDLIATRRNVATELYALSPHQTADCDLLLGAVETVLRDFRARTT